VILLDTQAAAWLATRSQRLSRPAAATIGRHSGPDGLAIASVTLMELAQMLASGQIRSTGTPREWLRGFVAATGVTIRDLTVDIVAVAAHLPPDFPGDPFDRVVAATAIVERAPLVTSDARIRDSRVVRTIW
jgi:PIN domain nuclease of toxin-antitoxin system